MVARQRNELEILYGLNHDGDAITDELSNTKTNDEMAYIFEQLCEKNSHSETLKG